MTNITAKIVLEIIGKPAKHIVESLGGIISQLEAEKGIKILEKKINEPKQIKDQKEFFTTFAEIEIDTEGVMYLLMVVFKYMPAHIEIISPEKMILENHDLNEVLNELTRRLHGYDEIARVLQIKNQSLEEQLKGKKN